MTKEQYIENVSELNRKHSFALNQLRTEFAFSNAKYKIGDIIDDYQGRILVDKITLAPVIYGSEFPGVCYQGYALKKNNTIKKNKQRESIFSYERGK